MYLDGTYAKGTTITDADGNKIEKVLWLRAGNSHVLGKHLPHTSFVKNYMQKRY